MHTYIYMWNRDLYSILYISVHSLDPNCQPKVCICVHCVCVCWCAFVFVFVYVCVCTWQVSTDILEPVLWQNTPASTLSTCEGGGGGGLRVCTGGLWVCTYTCVRVCEYTYVREGVCVQRLVCVWLRLEQMGRRNKEEERTQARAHEHARVRNTERDREEKKMLERV